MSRRLEVALAVIARDAGLRREAVRIAREELERDMVEQVEAGVVYLTPTEARRWWYERPDGVRVALEWAA